MGDTVRKLVTRFDWHKSEPLHALLCMPGMALPLFVGIHFGYPGTAALMVGGAQCVGFGSYQPPLFTKSGPMIAAALGIAISALAGALCRDSTLAFTLVTVLWAVLYALSHSIGTSTAWVGQQCCIFLVISAAAPNTPGTTHDLVNSALLRGAGVLAGGLLQFALLWLIRQCIPQAQTKFSRHDFHPERLRWSFLLQEIAPGSGSFQFAIRMAVTATVSVLVFRAQTWTSAYWIAMTALLLPKPEFVQTIARGLLRAIGTLVGAVLCTLIVVELKPGGMWLAVLVLAFQGATYLLNTVNYGAFAVTLTGYICFVLAIAHQPPREVLAHRVLATLMGTGIALGVHIVFRYGRRILGIDPPPKIHPLEDRDAA